MKNGATIVIYSNFIYLEQFFILTDVWCFYLHVNLIERLISLGDNDEAIKEKINKILDEYTPRQFNTQEYKKYIDTLKNTFKIVKVVQIQRKDDNDSISGKIADFTAETISKLIQQGYEDALSK
jgi:NTE family protein